MKIEINLPEEVYNTFEFFCRLKNEDVKEKIIEMIEIKINSVEIDNF